jgi:hypothetical protein
VALGTVGPRGERDEVVGAVARRRSVAAVQALSDSTSSGAWTTARGSRRCQSQGRGSGASRQRYRRVTSTAQLLAPGPQRTRSTWRRVDGSRSRRARLDRRCEAAPVWRAEGGSMGWSRNKRRRTCVSLEQSRFNLTARPRTDPGSTRRATSAPDRVALLVGAGAGATAPSGGCQVEVRLLPGHVSSRPIAPRRE